MGFIFLYNRFGGLERPPGHNISMLHRPPSVVAPLRPPRPAQRRDTGHPSPPAATASFGRRFIPSRPGAGGEVKIRFWRGNSCPKNEFYFFPKGFLAIPRVFLQPLPAPKRRQSDPSAANTPAPPPPPLSITHPSCIYPYPRTRPSFFIKIQSLGKSAQNAHKII